MSESPARAPVESAGPDPTVLALLQRIDQRLDRLQTRVDQVEALTAEGLGLAAMIGDTVDSHLSALQARGVDVEQRGLALLRLIEKASSPELTSRLELLLSRTRELESSLAALGEVPNLAAAAADTLDARLAALQAQGIDLDERLDALWIAMERLTSPSALRALQSLFAVSTPHDAPCIQPHVTLSPMLQVLVDTADSINEAHRDADSVGPWGMFRAASEPEVRRAVGFGLTIARGLGRRLLQRTTGSALVPTNGSKKS